VKESRLLTIEEGAGCLHDGGVIAYPTEAVYGLGCDPGNESAVRTILELKSRPASAGLVLIADQPERFAPYIRPVDEAHWEPALASWPGPVTWLFPRAPGVPDWLAGSHPTIALRVTAHEGCRALCRAFGGPVVSTSANPRGEEPARTTDDVERYFSAELCGILAGELGEQNQPSEIRDLLTGKVIRSG